MQDRDGGSRGPEPLDDPPDDLAYRLSRDPLAVVRGLQAQIAALEDQYARLLAAHARSLAETAQLLADAANLLENR